MADREVEKMNLANLQLPFSSDGYKPIMPTSTDITTYEEQSQALVVSASNISFMQQQQQSANNVNVSTVSGGGGGVFGGGGVEQAKRKRGRPRKYGPDGSNSNNLGFNSTSSSPPPSSASNSTTKKARGRPPGSVSARKQQQQHQYSSAFGTVGVGFTPHVIAVQAGEDVFAKVMSFSQNGPRAVCILSANGAISNVTLYQAMTSGGTVTMEGRYDILSLTGSILLSDSGGQRSRTGGLSVSLAGPDGRVLGGGVAGVLTAASPVQVIVGSFMADGWKESVIQAEPLSSTPMHVPGASSGGNPSESSGGGPESPLNHSTGGCNNNNLSSIMPNMTWK